MVLPSSLVTSLHSPPRYQKLESYESLPNLLFYQGPCFSEEKSENVSEHLSSNRTGSVQMLRVVSALADENKCAYK
jgi:hypothetical protein